MGHHDIIPLLEEWLPNMDIIIGSFMFPARACARAPGGGSRVVLILSGHTRGASPLPAADIAGGD